MPIFISHTTEDNDFAGRVYSHLRYQHNIDCYIDDVDKKLKERQGKPDLTQLLIDNLKKCDTLLAVVTRNTRESWWVPFEIGAAREMPRAIVSFTTLLESSQSSSQETLPEYLLEWPRLRKYEDIDIFAEEYNGEYRFLQENIISRRYYSQRSTLMKDVRKFEASVMESLGQGRY